MKKGYELGRYTAGAAAARTGDEMSGPALLLAGLAVTGSAAVASSLLAGIMIAAAVGGPVFGVLLDRSARPGRLLTGALTGYASSLVVILVALGRIPIALSVLIAVRHREAPERLRAQIFTTGASLKLTAFAVGAAIAGPLAVRSLPGALLTAAACQLLAALSCALLWREAERMGPTATRA
ncbi:hypothetical protein OG905_33035 [Streptomyces sp. NBC_00322]|uniref:hypothetical protein n=1 Tax=Streptomyces sp. NBC_00322 TaxID=2975712 RepID=UPI002E29ED57|nr:hypothetical protein [Streptomyces sp. NBC_00322]